VVEKPLIGLEEFYLERPILFMLYPKRFVVEFLRSLLEVRGFPWLL